jgi:hypothetical protein
MGVRVHYRALPQAGLELEAQTEKAPSGALFRIDNCSSGGSRLHRARKSKLSYVRSKLRAILPLNRLHLIFEPQLQLFQPDFFQLFVVAEISFLGEGIKAGRVLQVFLSQFPEFFMTAQEHLVRSQHPADLPTGNLYRQSNTGLTLVQCQILGAISL